MFDIIQGRRVSDLEMLTFDDVDNYAAANRPSAGPAPQGDFVSFEEDPVGRFGDPFGRETVSKGLIGIRNASRRSVLNASFLPVEFDVADDMLVTLSPKRSDVSGRVVLGRIKKIHPKLNFGLFEAGDSDCRVERLVKSGRAVGLKAILTPPFKTEGGREVDADWVYSRRRGLTVFVEDKELLVAKSVGRSKEQLAITFGRTHGGFVVLTVPEDTYVDVTGLKEKGDVYLTSDTGSIQTRIKWASWRKTRRRIRF
jgi:hypothetical protein